MRLAIADPPYLGRARTWYGDGMGRTQLGAMYGGTAKICYRPADYHPEAHLWDDPETHRDLVRTIVRDYDGWVVAMAHDNLKDYLAWVPRTCKIGIWIKNRMMPGGSRVVNQWEPVVVYIPKGRRAAKGHTTFPRSHLYAALPNKGFPGAKPEAWTRWVLDMLGYDPETDTVDDLFPGSNAVTDVLRTMSTGAVRSGS